MLGAVAEVDALASLFCLWLTSAASAAKGLKFMIQLWLRANFPNVFWLIAESWIILPRSLQ